MTTLEPRKGKRLVTQALPRNGTSRWLSLAVLCAGMLMIVLDQTIVNVALPSIQADLGFSQSNLAWVVNAYLIAFGGLLLLAGRMGDLIGRRRIFLIGLAVFTAASLVCGLSQSQEMLIVSRFVQGIGGATTSAVILGMVVTMFPEPYDRARAIGVYSFVASAGASIGLLAGGLLTQALNWHWIFFVNIPIGILTAVLTLRLLESDAGIGLSAGADVVGAVLVTASLMLGVYAIVETTDYAWGSVHTIGFSAVAVVLLAGFLIRQGVAAKPLMPLSIFKSRNISGGNAIGALMVAGMIGMFFLSTLYMERVLEYAPLQIGLAFLPASLGISVLSLGPAPSLVMRFGVRPMLMCGLSLTALGLALFARTPVAGHYVTDLLAPMALIGLGVGLAFPALMTLIMSGVTPDESGLASGLVNTVQQVGGALGLAVLAALSTARTQGLLVQGQKMPSALTGGYHLAFAIGAVLVALAVVIATLFLRPAAFEDQRVNAVDERIAVHVA